MSAEQTAWCKLFGKLVGVKVVPGRRDLPRAPGLPPEGTVSDCLEKDERCFGTGCPLTTDSAGTPFGDVGECDDRPKESLDPSAEPSFEGEWD